MQKISIVQFLPGIAWLFIVLVLTCLPGQDIPKAGWLDHIYFDKWVHTGLFAVLTFLFCRPLGRTDLPKRKKMHYFIKIAMAASIWGLTTEVLQRFYVPGRSFDLVDWAADSLGALLGFWFCSKRFAKATP